MKKIYVLLMLCLMMITCNKDVEPYNIKTEIKVSEIGTTTAKVEAMSEEAGFDELDAVLEYSSDEDFSDLKQTEMKWDEDCFMAEVSQLKANTKYYYKVILTGKYNSTATEVENFVTLNMQLPMVTTNNVSGIKSNSATCGGNVTSDGDATVTARGVCWSTSQNPTTNDNKTIDGSGTGSFNSNLLNLDPNTRYYVRAYATNEKGTSYGDEKSFTTLEKNPDINGHEYVDLGLPSGLKWATCNVGASSPEDYGNYYAWGETESAPNNNYNESNCSTHGLDITLLKSQGYIDEEGNLKPQRDAAAANWGGSWRMPTKAECYELLENCTWTWTAQNGVNGYKVTSKVNSNYIFLPAAGYRFGSSHYYAGEYGRYWTSTPNESLTSGSYYLYFNSGIHRVDWSYRHYGQSVRPVSE